MQIDKDASIVVIVKRDWVNLHGVKMFLRRPESVTAEIRGVDESTFYSPRYSMPMT
jgi:hypothetical protein